MISIQAHNIPELGSKANLKLVPYTDVTMNTKTIAADFFTGTLKEVRAWKCQPKQDGKGIDSKYLPINCR